MPLTRGSRIGPYEIDALIGTGGTGDVYRATDTRLHRQVALKVLHETLAGDADRMARFQREATVLASINHRNIAQVYGFERCDPSTGSRQAATYALVMELVEGYTLADRIAEGRIPVDEAIDIAKQIADALETVHNRGIVHRDLIPGREGRRTVAGLSRRRGGAGVGAG